MNENTQNTTRTAKNTNRIVAKIPEKKTLKVRKDENMTIEMIDRILANANTEQIRMKSRHVTMTTRVRHNESRVTYFCDRDARELRGWVKRNHGLARKEIQLTIRDCRDVLDKEAAGEGEGCSSV